MQINVGASLPSGRISISGSWRLSQEPVLSILTRWSRKNRISGSFRWDTKKFSNPRCILNGSGKVSYINKGISCSLDLQELEKPSLLQLLGLLLRSGKISWDDLYQLRSSLDFLALKWDSSNSSTSS